MNAEKSNPQREGLVAGYSPPLLRPRSRTRWILFVGFNLLAYLFACMMWQYLRSGEFLDLTSLQKDITTPMGQILLEPLSLFTHPWMIPVIGLLLAVLLVVPLSMAVMYQLLLSMVFVLILAVVGHSPIFAMAVAAGCLVSARTRLRRDYPFLAGLMGLTPICLYLYLMAYAGIDARMYQPVQMWILAVPFFLSILVAVLALTSVVWMARMTKFQPGVLWPSLLVLLPAATGLFFWRIGPAELDYALLTQGLGTNTSILPSVSQEDWRTQRALPLGEPVYLDKVQSELWLDAQNRITQCDAFLDRYGRHTRRAPAVAWLRAQYHSLQVESKSLQEGRLILYTAEFAKPQSQPAWEALATEFPASDQAAIAHWRLGELTLRSVLQGDSPCEIRQRVEIAWGHLLTAEEELRRIVQARKKQDVPAEGGVFFASPSLPLPGAYEQALRKTEKLLWLIEGNAIRLRTETPTRDDTQPARALASLLALNPHDPEYVLELYRLMYDKTFGKTQLADNLQMEVAKQQNTLKARVETLLDIAKDERTDAAIEANYELGRIAMQTSRAAVLPEHLTLQPAANYFRRVVAAPGNPWQEEARRNLRWLESRPPTTAPTEPEAES
jgi:hypothetical protein